MSATQTSPLPRALRIGRAAWLALAAVAAAAGALLWSRAAPPPAAGWVTELTARGPIEASVSATGTVAPVTVVQVGTYVSGPILEILVDYNSPVSKGQLVARIDPRPFEVKVQQAEALLATAKARVEKARADLALRRVQLERSRVLEGRDMLATTELDTARSAFEQARAQLALDRAGVQQAEAQLGEARINLGYTDITSPVDGVVVSRSVDVGQTVAASFQTPTLFEIAQDLSAMQAVASVSEADIGGVREGQAAWFTVDAWPERRFEGRVVQVRNAAVTLQNVVTYEAVIAVDNDDLALKPGMTATVTIITARKDDVLRVPARALRFRPEDASAAADGPAVYVPAADGDLRRVDVETGLRSEDYVEVRAGDLAPGDAVVVARARPAVGDEPPPRSPFQPRRR